MNSFILNLRAAFKAIIIGKNWKNPSPAAVRTRATPLFAAVHPKKAVKIATIPFIIPAAASGPRKGWKILETISIKASKGFFLTLSSSSASTAPLPCKPPTANTSA